MQNIVIRKAVLFGVLFLFGYSVFSQQGIGTNNPETSSVLEIKSNSLGVLIPRLTNSQMETIASPADGLMVYCLDCPSLGIYTFNSTTSQFLLNGPNNELEATVPGISTVSSTITKYGKISTEVKITDTQGLPVTEKGIVYSSTNTSPILSNSTSVINYYPLVNGTFSNETNGLLPETIYHIRSFATNIHGTSYGEVSTHTTPSAFVYTIVPTNQQYRLPLSQDVSNNYLIDWGDGSESYMIPSMSQADRNNAILHTYSSTSTVTIMVYGDLGKIIETTVNSARMIRDISNWGSAIVGTKSFKNCQNLSISATNLPNLDANLAYTFSGATSFNSDISNWDTSNVTTMEGIFYDADAFNQPIGTWNVSSVTDMYGLFYSANSFNQNINNWETSSVTTMRNMFSGADAFNQPIGTWDVSSVTDMYGLFDNADSFNQNLSNWNTSSVTNMGYMFAANDVFNNNGEPLTFNTSSVTIMQNMFYGTGTFNQDISSWDTSNVTNMRTMFRQAAAFNQDISSWNTSSVTTMIAMFYGTTLFNNGDSALAWSSGFGSNCNLTDMFRNATVFNQNLSSWNTSKVKTATNMFNGSPFNNGSVALDWDDGFALNANLSDLFNNARNFNVDISNWDTSNVISMQSMFEQAVAFNNGGVALDWDDGFGTNASLVKMFYNATNFNADISIWNTSNVTNLSNTFWQATSFNQDISQKTVTVNGADYTAWDTSNVTNMNYTFHTATAFNQNIGNWDTSSVPNGLMNGMFVNATVFNQDLSGWCVLNFTTSQGNFATNSALTAVYMPVWGQSCD